MKHYFSITMRRSAALGLVAAVMTILSSCQYRDEDASRSDDSPLTYTLSIPATIAVDATRAVAFNETENTCTATFTDAEHVYVYNKSENVVMNGYLTPYDISAGGTSCHLTGTLSDGTISANDELILLYNLSSFSTDKNHDNYKWDNNFDYSGQNGTADGVVDGATATVIVDGYTPGGELTTSAAEFRSVQSMFRFLFEDENGQTISVNKLTIHSDNNVLAKRYQPLHPSYKYVPENITVNPGSATSDFLYFALCIDEDRSDGDNLVFVVEDGAGKSYMGRRDAPSGGFRNGKYYYNSSPISLVNTPAITWTNPSNPIFPDDDKCFRIGTGDYDITLSGTSNDCRFEMDDFGTLRFNNLTATTGYYPFITGGYYNDLMLEISGNDTIISEYPCPLDDIDELKLCGNGTLTIACEDNGYYGIYSNNYSGDHDPSTITADGYTVTRSDQFNIGEKYAWTYTVTND